MPLPLNRRRISPILGGIAAFIFALLAIGPFVLRYFHDREWNARVDKLAAFYQTRGSMSKKEYWSMANVGADVVRDGGRIQDAQLASVLAFSSRVHSKDSSDESPLTTALGQLLSVKKFDKGQASQVSRFVDQELTRPHSPLVGIIICKIGCRVGSANARNRLQILAQDPNPQVARIAKILESRMAQGKLP